MGRLLGCVPVLEMVLLASACAGCGGGSSVTQPPPPQPDFSLNLSTNSISVSQGGATSAVNVSINPSNGFSGNVQVTLSGLPTGVTSNPASPFDVAAGASISVVFGAASNAATGNFTLSAQGSSGALSHSQTNHFVTHDCSACGCAPRNWHDSVFHGFGSWRRDSYDSRQWFRERSWPHHQRKDSHGYLKDPNTLSATVPALTPGPQRITITNPDGESVSLDAAITAN